MQHEKLRIKPLRTLAYGTYPSFKPSQTRQQILQTVWTVDSGPVVAPTLPQAQTWLSFNTILHLYKKSWVSVNVTHHQLRYPFSLSLAAHHSEFIEISLSAMAAWKWVSFSLWSMGRHLYLICSHQLGVSSVLLWILLKKESQISGEEFKAHFFKS